MKRGVLLKQPAAGGSGDDDRRRHDNAARLGTLVEHHDSALDWEGQPFGPESYRSGAVLVDGIGAPSRPIDPGAAQPMRVVYLCERAMAIEGAQRQGDELLWHPFRTRPLPDDLRAVRPLQHALVAASPMVTLQIVRFALRRHRPGQPGESDRQQRHTQQSL